LKEGGIPLRSREKVPVAETVLLKLYVKFGFSFVEKSISVFSLYCRCILDSKSLLATHFIVLTTFWLDFIRELFTVLYPLIFYCYSCLVAVSFSDMLSPSVCRL